eukprot:7237814-Lingulodinium_polyedra.AAC.1
MPVSRGDSGHAGGNSVVGLVWLGRARCAGPRVPVGHSRRGLRQVPRRAGAGHRAARGPARPGPARWRGAGAPL